MYIETYLRFNKRIPVETIINTYLDVKIKTGSTKYGYKLLRFELYYDPVESQATHNETTYCFSNKNVKKTIKKLRLKERDIRHIRKIDIKVRTMFSTELDLQTLAPASVTRFAVNVPIPTFKNSKIRNAINNPANTFVLNKRFEIAYYNTILTYMANETFCSQIRISNISNDAIHDLFTIIESRFTGSNRYKVLDGDHDTIIIKDSVTNTDFEIKVKEFD